MSVILGARDLHIRYGKVKALHGANLKVEPGQTVTVIGPSGAGKSTMPGAAMGVLLMAGPASGVISYLDHNLTGLPVEKRVARGICLVPEKRELFATMNAEDNLALDACHRKRAGERSYLDQMEVVYDLFSRLKEHRAQEAGTFSGGECQILAVGRALMAKPQLPILDKPSLGLAPFIVEEIFHITSNPRKTGVVTLLIEQNARATLQVTGYGYVLETDDMTLRGTTQELAANPRIIETYLGLAKKIA